MVSLFSLLLENSKPLLLTNSPLLTGSQEMKIVSRILVLYDEMTPSPPPSPLFFPCESFPVLKSNGIHSSLYHCTLAADWSTGWWPDPLAAALLEWWSLQFVVGWAGQVTHCPGRAGCLSTAVLNYYMLSNRKRATGASCQTKTKETSHDFL